MKILHVITSLNPVFGGPVGALRDRVEEVNRQGHQLEVLTLDTPGQPWHEGYPATVHHLGPAQLPPYNFNRSLRRWLLDNGPRYDVIVGHGLWQYPGWLVSRIAKRLEIPYFVFVHGQLDPWFKQAYPLKHLKKALYWHLFEYRNLRRASAVLFTTEEERILSRQSFSLEHVNTRVVQYGVRTPVLPLSAPGSLFLADYPRLKNRRRLLFLSRLHPKKGCDVLLEAFARVAPAHPELELVMAGPDEKGYKADLQQLAERLGIAQRITWTGMLSGERKLDSLRSSEALVLPSHSENFGVVVAEALACGLPVLISDKVNIWREVAADGAGLVSEDTVPAYTALLQRWLALEESERDAMRECARHSFSSRFEIRASVESYLSILAATERSSS